MRVLRRIPVRPLRLRSPVAAIGIFDGVHRGHQAILRKAVARARVIRGTPTAVTFYPHPLAVLVPRLVPPLLLSLKQRLDAFAREGIQAALVIPFTRRFSRWSPDDFVKRLLVDRLRLREVVVGHDFGFGHRRLGSIATLKAFGRRHGFQVRVVGPVAMAGERIASNRIRQMIRRGELFQAARLLGRPVSVVGRVVPGSARGRRIGFPTANCALEAGVLPAVGVYAVRGKVGSTLYPGMANIGFRPTFGRKNRQALLEVHLFGCRRSLYGKRLEVSFVKRLRPERRFPSAQILSRQLARDARRARALERALQAEGRVV